MDKRKQKSIAYLLRLTALIAFLFLLVYSLTSKKVMHNLFSYTSYYLTWLLIIVWSVQTALVLRASRFSLKALLQKHWQGIVIALILTSLVFATVRVRFKTLSDETNMLAVSKSMLNDKTIFNSTMGMYYFGNYNSIRDELPIRPLVFPFLTHLLHTVTGYRYQNPFVLNFIIMFLFLSGVYIIARKFSDIPSSIAAMLLILSYPVFTIFGTSGCFDLLNTVFFFLVMVAVYYFLKNPSSTRLGFVFSSLLVLANVRYESIIFLVIIPLLLIKKMKWNYLKDCSYLLSIAPLMILPYIWQRILKPESHPHPTSPSLFSLSSFKEHITVILKNLVDFEYFLPYAGFLSIISILILIYLIVGIVRKRIPLKKCEGYLIFVLTGSFLLSSFIYFSYFLGDYTHPSTARFFITLSVALALVPIALRVVKPKLISAMTVLIFSVVCFLFYHPIAVEGRFINTLTLNRRTEHCIDFLSKLDDRNILIIAARPGQYAALGYGAIDFAYANKNQELLLRQLSRHLFSRIIVFQQILYENNKSTPDTTLHPGYDLQHLHEIQVTADRFLRISQVAVH